MKYKIGIIGLGYVGLPLAVEFGKKFSTIGFDVNSNRVNDLKKGHDITGEVSKRNVSSSLKLKFSSKVDDLSVCNIYIIAVPTPIDKNNNPNLSILISASEIVGNQIKKGDIVIYESTVYPGCTEEECVPVLEKTSKLKYNKDFFCGYSPERISPGDKKRTLTKIQKITSGSNEEIALKVDKLYNSIIKAGTYKAESIKIAEAAKIIENCQRDINIAFVNELSILFNKMDINTNKVLEAAGTKWNFLPFKPGLVGGHCIGVDPFYLTYKAKKLGYESKIILSGRKLNNSMAKEIAGRILNKFKNNKKISKPKGLIFGVTFKENCPDIRNSKVFDLYEHLKNDFELTVYDPYASKNEVDKRHNISLIDFGDIKYNAYDFILIAVAHSEFININIEDYCKNKKTVIFDLKNIYDKKEYLTL
tara:strand:- start:1895 stop:3151 length:1257 start_codon:yes stop_codon:yes gene_type:complete